MTASKHPNADIVDKAFNQAYRELRSKPLDVQIQQAMHDLKRIAAKHPDLATTVCVSICTNARAMKERKGGAP